MTARGSIEHVVVLMLENRSFDSMLGMLRPKSDAYRGLDGSESNVWHRADGSTERIAVWTSPDLTRDAARVPDPDPGEQFHDIEMQIRGLAEDGSLGPLPGTMGGFVDDYMRQKADAPRDPAAVMHAFTPDQVPVISTLARAFGASDAWHAAAPTQTWPNRFFTHAGTADGWVNNNPTHFPYEMPTVFSRLETVGRSWRVYFHDVPQAIALSDLWRDAFRAFRPIEAFFEDARKGALPNYSFLEPRYFVDPFGGVPPNDQHPPHDVRHGEMLIAQVYNALRAGPGWRNTLFVLTYDEHGGCYDHVVPPAATPPDDRRPDGFAFDRFGVRVPTVIVSPRIPAGSILRAPGAMPFDHTSIIATLRALWGFAPLTARDAAAPHLLDLLTGDGSNDGPDRIEPPPLPSFGPEVAHAAAQMPNDMQAALATAALNLPTIGADLAAHAVKLASAVDVPAVLGTVGDAVKEATARLSGFLGH